MTILRTDKIAGLESVNAITGSVNFPNDGATGTGDYLRVDRKDNSDFNLGTNDFTMEFWFNSRNVGSTLFPFAFAASTVSASSDAGFYVRFNGGGVNFNCFEGNNTIGACTTGSVNIDTWYHVAYVRSGSTFTVYLDGTSAATASSAEAVNYDAGWNFNIGSAYSNTYHYNGYLSNVRIVNGKALYTSNFTVPTRQLEVTPETVLLCCHSSQDFTQEETGKTLTTIKRANCSGPLLSSFTPDVGNDHTHGTVLEGNIEFPSLNYMTLPRGTTIQSNRGRGLFMGGYVPGAYKSGIDAIQIQSLGNSITFGNLSHIDYAEGTSVASATRAVKGGKASGGNHIEYVTIATTGNAIDFGGDLTSARRSLTGISNGSRGVFCGGAPTIVNIMDYITIATTGVNAADFGDLTVTRRSQAAASSPTRGVVGGGNANPANSDVIDYITIASTGDATDFGNLTVGRRELGGCSSSTRGVFACGWKNPGAFSGEIDYITIASTGNATDFGDSVLARSGVQGTSNSIRGIFKGGASPTYQNAIEYVTIATTGNSVDFGDGIANAAAGIIHYGGCSDSHGGIA